MIAERIIFVGLVLLLACAVGLISIATREAISPVEDCAYLCEVDPNDPIYTNLWTVEGTERDLIFENLAILQERCDALAYGKADKGDK
jgi:hypothetical protein